MVKLELWWLSSNDYVQRDQRARQIMQQRMQDTNFNTVEGRQEVYNLVMSMLEFAHEL